MSLGSCFYCLVTDDESVPAVTSFDGTVMCTEHAKVQARMAAEQERANAAEGEQRYERIAHLRPPGLH